MKITVTPKLYKLLTADTAVEDYTVEQLLEMITEARESVEYSVEE